MKQSKHFIDYAKITITNGSGGDGAIAFRREKFVPAGGPAGGNGGKGGDVIFKASAQIKTLFDFQYSHKFKAELGQNGGSKDCSGKNGKHLIIKVPVGTVIKNNEDRVLADLIKDEQEYIALKGGRGGRGNAHFSNSTNKTPRFAEPGEIAVTKDIILELKVLADVGLVGLPNAGKSTLLSAITNAKPKIADYPFTTLNPELGAIFFKDREGFIIADIPGLIEGAHKGMGLGHEFLRHIERTKLIVNLIDITLEDPFWAYKIIRNELELYPHSLSSKPEIIVLNKTDLYPDEEVQKWHKHFKQKGFDVYLISALAHIGLNELIDIIDGKLMQITNYELSITNYKDEKLFNADYKITITKKGIYEIKSPYLEKIVYLTDMTDSNAIFRFQNIIEKMGINQALKKAGAQDNDTVKIGGFEFTYFK